MAKITIKKAPAIAVIIALILQIPMFGIFSFALSACAADYINPGDVVINEIMQNPDAVNDSDGEWFELYNTTDTEINLESCIISDSGGDSHIIENSLIMPAGGYAVLVRNNDYATNGGVSADYEYSGFILVNSDDEIILTCNDIEIDRVEYDGGPNFPDPTGASMILENVNLGNNNGANWCVSISPYGDGDLGTPGAQNDSCNGIICEAIEKSRECVSDGYAEVIYEWNDLSCGNDYIEIEEDSDCNCVEIEVPGQCADKTYRQFTFTYNFDYCEVRDPENREDETCAGDDSECVDNDGDGYGENCPLGNDCDDDNLNINPGAEEICNNIDDDCDGTVDLFSRVCYTGSEGTEGIGICHEGSQMCTAGEWGNCEGEVLPEEEICDELDNNCNGKTDEGGVCDTGEEPVNPGGGGGYIAGLTISAESVKSSDVSDVSEEISMKIIWITSQFSTSAVIYDIEPGKFNQSEGASNYGCAYSKQGDDSGLEKVTGHSVTLTGLKPNTIYYYHTISSASPPVFSREYEFTTGEALELEDKESAEDEAEKDIQGKVAGATTTDEEKGEVLGESEPPMLPCAGGETAIIFIFTLIIFGFGYCGRKNSLFAEKK